MLFIISKWFWSLTQWLEEKWLSWYQKNKRRNWRKIEMADSPKREDVDAVYEGLQALNDLLYAGKTIENHRFTW